MANAGDRTFYRPKPRKKPPRSAPPTSQDPSLAQALDAFRNFSAWEKRFRARPFGSEIALASRMFPDFGGSTLTPTQMRRQASADVQGILGPQIAQLKALYDQRSRSGSAAYRDFTNVYQGRLADIAQGVQGVNQQAYEQSLDANAALGDFVRDRGNSLSEGLAKQMAQINAPEGTVADVAGGAANFAWGSSNDVAAGGQIGLDQLLGDTRADTSFAKMLPAFGILEGQRELGNFQRGLNTQMREDVSGIMSRMPELTYNVYQNLLSNQQDTNQLRSQRAQTILSYLSDAQQRGLNANIAGAGISRDMAQMYADLYGTQLGAQTQRYGYDLDYASQAQDRAAAANAAKTKDKISAAEYWGSEAFGNTFATLQSQLTDPLGNPRQLGKPGLIKLRKRVIAMIRSQVYDANAKQVYTWADNMIRSLGYDWPPKPARGSQRPGPSTAPSPESQDAAAEQNPLPIPGGWDELIRSLLIAPWG